jgi:hypothetical protein
MIEVHNDSAKNHLRRYARARGQACGATRQLLVKPQGTRQFDALLCNNLQHVFTLFSVKLVFFLTGGGAAGGCSGATFVFVLTGSKNQRVPERSCGKMGITQTNGNICL